MRELGSENDLRRAPAVALQPAKRQPSALEIEESLDQLSRWMDGLFRIPGTSWRFGLDALVGLIPGVGDTATTIVSFYVMAAGVRYGVPKITLLRMGLNIALDYVFGSVPIIGDLFDAAWKSNRKNVELIRRSATVSREEARHGRLSDWLLVGVIMLVLLLLLVGSITVAFWILSYLASQLPSPF